MSTITAASVSRILNKQFKRATRTTTRVRGYYNETSGFEVREVGDYIMVDWIIIDRTQITPRQHQLKWMREYLEYIGYKTETQFNDKFSVIKP